MRLVKGVLASSAVVTALLVPAVAQAGTVSVENIPGTTNEAVLKFVAAPGETNQVTIAPTVPQQPGLGNVTVIDKGAPLQAGAGCSGGGAPGTTVTCVVHAPKGAEHGSCDSHDCLPPEIPGTAWRSRITAELGDGDDSFDDSAFTGEFNEGWNTEVNGGPGNDTITTGGGNDRIVPGPGNDVVHANGGKDTAIADPTPDGNDVLNLGGGTYNVVDDSARTEPLTLEGGILGGPGEADVLEGLNIVVGGSGNDHFHSAGTEWLEGGPGDDTLIGSENNDNITGGPGNDTIRGEGGNDSLYGGGGNDNIEGGAGNDKIEEREEGEGPTEPLGVASTSSGGNDTINGGEGDDFIMAGQGEDTVEGGPGNDQIYGEAGNDTLNGGSGDDLIAGEGGADVINGGEGNDLLLAGRVDEFLPSYAHTAAVDTSVDQIDCGPGTDVVQANSWDSVVNCETLKKVSAVRLGKVERNKAKGSARATWSVGGTGSLVVTGHGVNPVSRQVTETARSSIPVEYSGVIAVRTTGATLAKLQRRGHVVVTLRLAWTPTNQTQVTETRKLKLVLKKTRRHSGHSGRSGGGR